MNSGIHISIPTALLIVVDDVGWWSGTDGSAFNQPFRTGMPRDHVPADYEALAALAKGLDMRIPAGFVLCEWDKSTLLRKLPSSTWMGDEWTITKQNAALKEEAAWIVRKERDHIEFALHGIGHEFWKKGVMERTEFHNSACEMRDPDEIRKHLEYFFRLMDQYRFNGYPAIFIPPALKHSFGKEDKGFQKILSEFGIQYVTLVFSSAKMMSEPQTSRVAWESNVLLVDRGKTDIKWNVPAPDPFFLFDRPVMALHWSNILHPDPDRNLDVVRRWIDYIQNTSRPYDFFPARDARSCFTQYLHQLMSTIRERNGKFIVDMGWINTVSEKILGDHVFFKIEKPDGIGIAVSGTRISSSERACEAPFLKLCLPGNGKIVLSPYQKNIDSLSEPVHRPVI